MPAAAAPLPSKACGAPPWTRAEPPPLLPLLPPPLLLLVLVLLPGRTQV